MKKFLLNIWMTFGMLIEYQMSKMGLIKCIDLMAMEDNVVDNMGGTLSYMYVVLANDVATWPTEPSIDTATMEEIQVNTGEWTCSTGKNFFKVEFEPEKCSITSEDVGAKGSIGQKHVLKVFKGSMEKKILGFIRATNNQKLAFAVPDANGNLVQIGSEKYPARKTPEGNATTGEGPEGESGSMITFVSYGNGPAPLLDDAITISTTPVV